MCERIIPRPYLSRSDGATPHTEDEYSSRKSSAGTTKDNSLDSSGEILSDSPTTKVKEIFPKKTSLPLTDHPVEGRYFSDESFSSSEDAHVMKSSGEYSTGEVAMSFSAIKDEETSRKIMTPNAFLKLRKSVDDLSKEFHGFLKECEKTKAELATAKIQLNLAEVNLFAVKAENDLLKRQLQLQTAWFEQILNLHPKK